MKSKPPSKKAKLDPPLPAISLEGTSTSSRSAANASPSLSTSSSASSLLSIPPPTSTSTPKASTAMTASELVAAAKMAAATAKAQAAAAASLLSRAATAPSYPLYNHPDVSEFPRMQLLLSVGSASAGGEGKLPIVLGPEGGLTMEDLDGLQGELETLWSSLAVRIRSLKVEQAILQNSAASGNVSAVLGEHYDPHHQEKINAVASLIDAGHGTRTSVSAAAKLVMGSQIPVGGTGSPGAVGTGLSKKTATGASRLDKLPKKKLKGDAGGLSKKGGEKPARATQNRSHSVSSDFGGLDGFYKHEAPSEFWEFADNYCGEVTPDHLLDLSKMIDEHKVVPDNLFDIPSLGKHFQDSEENSKGKTREHRTPKRVDACGPLTQRLVSALVDERVAMYNSQRSYSIGSPREDGGVSNYEQGFIHRAGLIKALGLDSGPNRPPMENQLRECLLDRGLLRPDDANDPLLFNPDDEILGEIKRTQNTLKKLQHYNSDKLHELYSKSKNELDRSAHKKELEKADKEVIEAYKSIASMRMKKKPVTKKEKDAATKALEIRNRALQKLSPSINSESVDPGTVLKVEV